MSAYHLTRILLPSMINRKSGHIFNMCSIASLQAYSNGGAYSISKFALAGFSKNLREEMKQFGIKVTSVYPVPLILIPGPHLVSTPTASWKPEIFPRWYLLHPICHPRPVWKRIILRPQLGDV
jgi:NAD(P)-dependent dehydrogenase (short-subunit alcohol dehydrogenase family)